MRYWLIPSLLLAVAVGAWAQTDDEYAIRLERVKASTEYLERYCLSGYEVSGDASVKAGISGLKKLLTDGLAGSLSAKGVARDARGDINDAAFDLRVIGGLLTKPRAIQQRPAHRRNQQQRQEHRAGLALFLRRRRSELLDRAGWHQWR